MTFHEKLNCNIPAYKFYVREISVLLLALPWSTSTSEVAWRLISRLPALNRCALRILRVCLKCECSLKLPFKLVMQHNNVLEQYKFYNCCIYC